MTRPRRSRKHPLFILLIFTGLLVAVVSYFTASTIAKEIKAGAKLRWIPYFTISLTVLSCIHAALSIILFTSLPPRQIPCCSLFTITTLFLGTAWTLSTVAQIFEEPNSLPSSSPINADPPMLKTRAILSGVVALAMFASALPPSFSAFDIFNDEVPEGRDSQEPPLSSPFRSHSPIPKRHKNEERTPLPFSNLEQDPHSGPVELDSYPIRIYQTQRESTLRN